LSAQQVVDEVLGWAAEYSPDLAKVITAHRTLAEQAVDIERAGVANPRKDLGKWSDFRSVYGFFFPEYFEPVADPADNRFGGLDADLVSKLAEDFASGYSEHVDQPVWFAQIRELAVRHGFAPSPREHKSHPEVYPGSVREVANTIRVALTGSTRSPDLHAVALVLGTDEVMRRVRALVR
jgi:glutamyl-tRNA synthetase